MAMQWAYVSEAVHQDDVPAAIAAAKAKAIAKIGATEIELFQYTWVSKEVCTVWRRWTPDPPPPK